jgi:hypothetical protein
MAFILLQISDYIENQKLSLIAASHEPDGSAWSGRGVYKEGHIDCKMVL